MKLGQFLPISNQSSVLSRTISTQHARLIKLCHLGQVPGDVLGEPSMFLPNLVVETTLWCNQNCNGCYSPTHLVENAHELPESTFLSVAALEAALRTLSPGPEAVIGVRGGEPTLHPHLAEILQILRKISSRVYLETNGERFLEEGVGQQLTALCKKSGVIVKISFDSMHQLKPQDLLVICSKLNLEKVEWCIAVTEFTQEGFERTLALCPWIPRERAIFQCKATTATGLLVPSLGVVHVDGSIGSGMATKVRFLPRS